MRDGDEADLIAGAQTGLTECDETEHDDPVDVGTDLARDFCNASYTVKLGDEERTFRADADGDITCDATRIAQQTSRAVAGDAIEWLLKRANDEKANQFRVAPTVVGVLAGWLRRNAAPRGSMPGGARTAVVTAAVDIYRSPEVERTVVVKTVVMNVTTDGSLPNAARALVLACREDLWNWLYDLKFPPAE